MKILSLKIPVYKNLRDIDLSFESTLITLLVGQNGLGKSNLIEILASIFKDLYSFREKKQYKEEASYGSSFDYALEYECRNKIIKIQYIDGDIKFYKKNNRTKEYNNISFARFKKESNLLLPNRIVGYYSGENKRIKELWNNYLDKYQSEQMRLYKSPLNNKNRSKIFFSENFHSQLVLFTLFIYREHPNYNTAIKYLINGILNINVFQNIEFLIKSPISSYEIKRKGISLLDIESEILSGVEYESFENRNIFWGIRGDIDLLLKTFLFNFIGTNSYSIYEENKKEYFSITLNSSDKDFLNAIYDIFPNPITFFDALERLYVINSLSKITIEINKKTENEFFKFESLSEGEQQLISVLGLMTILNGQNEEILFLLDEPDTHINPLWQREYVNMINKCIDNQRSKHIFLATHSPFIVQAYEEQQIDLLLFRKSEEETVVIDVADHTIKNWRIDHVLMSPYFNLKSTRPAKLDEFMQKRKDLIMKGMLSEDDKSELESLKNELGFLPTGETITELESIAFINSSVNILKKEKK